MVVFPLHIIRTASKTRYTSSEVRGPLVVQAARSRNEDVPPLIQAADTRAVMTTF